MISNVQLQRKFEKYKKDFLNKGINFTNYKLNQMLLDVDKDKLGIPSFKEFNIKPHSISNKEEWNSNFKNLDEDINVLIESIYKLQSDYYNDNFLIQKYKDDCAKYLNDILNYNNELESLLNDNSINNSFSFVPNDLYKIELDGAKPNLPKTTSYIDLKKTRVINHKIKNNTKVNIMDSEIKITNTLKKIKECGNITDILNDSPYSYKLYTEGDGKGCDVTINIKFNNPKQCSAISISLEYLTLVICELTVYTDDGDIIKNNISTYEEYEWSFKSVKAKEINIKLTKQQPEGYNEENNLYDYLFIIRNISLFNERYEESSVFVSGANLVDNIFGDVKISPVEDVQPDTNITYFAGINNSKNITWTKLDKGRFTDMNLLEQNREILNCSISDYGRKENGLYYIGKLKNNINDNSIILRSGYQQWDCTVIGGKEFNKNYIIDINSYDKTKILEQCFIDNESIFLKLKTNKLVFLTTEVVCDDEYLDEGNYIKSFNTEDVLQTVLYVNNVNITKQSDGKYNIPLNKGKNKVILMLYIGSNEDKYIDIEFNFNFKKTSQNITTGLMKKVELGTLKNIIQTKDFYALDGDKIYVNFNPLQTSKYLCNKPLLQNREYEEDSGYFNYNGRWNTITQDKDEKITGIYSTQPDDTIKFKFKGKSISLYNNGSINRGTFLIDIDGEQYYKDSASTSNNEHEFFNKTFNDEKVRDVTITVKDRNKQVSVNKKLDLNLFTNRNLISTDTNKNILHCTKIGVRTGINLIGYSLKIYGNKGPNYGIIRVITDGIVNEINCNNTTASNNVLLTEINLNYQGGHTLAFEISENSPKEEFIITNIVVKDNNCMTDNIYSINDSNVKYTGTWSRSNNIVTSSAANNIMEFNFIGNEIKINGEFTNYNACNFKLFIDENYIGTYSNKEVQGISNGPLIYQNGLESTTHKLKILTLDGNQLKINNVQVFNGILVNSNNVSLSNNLFYLKKIKVISDSTKTISNVLTNGEYQSNNSNITYEGKWLYDIKGMYDSSIIKQTNNIGDTCTFNFYGNGIKIIGYKGNKYGIMEVIIDNTTYTVDLYNPNHMFNQTLLNINNLSTDNHKVTIKCTGRKNTKSTGTTIQFDKVIINGLILSDVNFQDYCRFLLKYKYINDDKSKRYEVNKGKKIDLRIMAILQTCNRDVTPQLFSYNIETR